MKCEICQRSLKLNRDHCHISGLSRGMLCTKCNVLLGMCKDDIEVLKSAIKYLNKYRLLHAEEPSIRDYINSLRNLRTDVRRNDNRFAHSKVRQDIIVLRRNYNRSSILGSSLNYT